MTEMLMNLSLFDAGAAGAEGAGAGAAAPASTQGDNTSIPGATRRGKGDKFANVLYGKQPAAGTAPGVTNAANTNEQAAAADTDVKVTSNTLEERRKAYHDFVEGEYKDIHTDEIQRIINRRFSETKNLQSRVDKTQPLIDMLANKYGIKDGDIDKITAAIEDDSVYWADAAEEAGMTPDQYKTFQKLQRENEALKRAEEDRRGQEYVQSQTQKWVKEAEDCKAKFPDFDFKAELQNPSFISMLKAGTPVEHAYKVLHFDEILGSVANTTAARTQSAVVNNIRARGNRPQEAGMASQSAFTIKDDVRKLTREDRAQIANRVKHGEHISF